MNSSRLTLENVCLPKEATIRQAMEKINQNCLVSSLLLTVSCCLVQSRMVIFVDWFGWAIDLEASERTDE